MIYFGKQWLPSSDSKGNEELVNVHFVGNPHHGADLFSKTGGLWTAMVAVISELMQINTLLIYWKHAIIHYFVTLEFIQLTAVSITCFL